MRSRRQGTRGAGLPRVKMECPCRCSPSLWSCRPPSHAFIGTPKSRGSGRRDLQLKHTGFGLGDSSGHGPGSGVRHRKATGTGSSLAGRLVRGRNRRGIRGLLHGHRHELQAWQPIANLPHGPGFRPNRHPWRSARFFYSERPGRFGLLGIGLVVFGVVASALEARSDAVKLTLATLLLALTTGVCTALYSAIDKLGAHLIHPMMYVGMSFGVGGLVQCFQLHLRKANFSMDGTNSVSCVGASLANTCGYVLVLYAMRIPPISHVVPTRSIAVLLGIAVGAMRESPGGGWSPPCRYLPESFAFPLLTTVFDGQALPCREWNDDPWKA